MQKRRLFRGDNGKLHMGRVATVMLRIAGLIAPIVVVAWPSTQPLHIQLGFGLAISFGLGRTAKWLDYNEVYLHNGIYTFLIGVYTGPRENTTDGSENDSRNLVRKQAQLIDKQLNELERENNLRLSALLTPDQTVYDEDGFNQFLVNREGLTWRDVREIRSRTPDNI